MLPHPLVHDNTCRYTHIDTSRTTKLLDSNDLIGSLERLAAQAGSFCTKEKHRVSWQLNTIEGTRLRDIINGDK